MKNNLLILSMFLFLLSSCEGNEDSKPYEFIQLAKNEISFGYKESKDTLEIQTNTSWEIESIPEWLTVSKQKGTKEDTKVILYIQPNRNETARKFDLIFKIKDQKQALHIYQEARPKPEYTLPRLGFTSLTRLVSGKYSETQAFDLEFEADKFFINSSNKELIFPGSLFSGTLTDYPRLNAISGYTYNTITMGIGYGINYSTIENFIPSYEAYRKIEKENIDKFTSHSTLSLTASNGEYYYSRRHLHCIGLYELGIPLEKLLNGKSYKEEPMKHEYGLIYPVAQTRFEAFMDQPNPSLLMKEPDKDEFAALNPNYVTTVNYGNNALLLVESDFDKGTVNSLKSKLSKNESLSNDEILKAQEIDAYYLYLVKVGEFKIIKGNLIEVIRQLNSTEPLIVPISFSFSDYYNNGVGTVKYKIHVE